MAHRLEDELNISSNSMYTPLRTYDLLFFSIYFKQCTFNIVLVGSGGDLAPSLGGRTIFSADPRFLNDFLGKKISIFAAKISDDFFSHQPHFSDFPFLYLCYIKCHF